MTVRSPLVMMGGVPTALPSGDSIVRRRTVAGAADTPTAADNDGIIFCTSSAAVTITANDLGDGVAYSIQQRGTGQVTVVAGAGATLVSDKATASFKTARRWVMIGVVCDGAGNVAVVGNTA